MKFIIEIFCMSLEISKATFILEDYIMKLNYF